MAALADKIPFVHLPSGLSPLDRAVLFQIRLPRVVLCALVGGLLAMAGAGYQGVFRNPLVDSGHARRLRRRRARRDARDRLPRRGGPGRDPRRRVRSARSAGVAVAYLTGAAASRRTVLGDGVATLLLAGIAVGCFLTAVQTFVLQRSASRTCRRSTTGCSARCPAASWQQVTSILPYAAVSIVVMLLHGRHLDVLAVGDEEARALGMRPATWCA